MNRLLASAQGAVVACLAVLALAGPAALVAAADFAGLDFPIHIGDPLDAILARLGERATFGADCGGWTGPSVDTQVRHQGVDLKLMGLLEAGRVGALRVERTLTGVPDARSCGAALDEYTGLWRAAGLAAADQRITQFDGPAELTGRRALRNGEPAGQFEARYRSSREECRVALILDRTAAD